MENGTGARPGGTLQGVGVIGVLGAGMRRSPESRKHRCDMIWPSRISKQSY